MFNFIIVRIGVFIGGMYQESSTEPYHTIASQTREEQQELLENLPGFCNIGISTLFIVQSIQFIYGKLYRKILILVMFFNLSIAGLLFTNDYIAVYFPSTELKNHVVFYLLSFFLFVIFSIIMLCSLFYVVFKRIRNKHKDEKWYKSKLGALLGIFIIITCYLFRFLLLFFEMTPWSRSEPTTFNYPDFDNDSAHGILFFLYYLFGELVPSIFLLYLSILLHQLPVAYNSNNNNSIHFSKYYNNNNLLGADQLIQKINSQNYEDLQQDIDYIIGSNYLILIIMQKYD